MHITPFGEKNFHLNTLFAISMAECLVANKILYCIIICFVTVTCSSGGEATVCGHAIFNKTRKCVGGNYGPAQICTGKTKKTLIT